MGRVFLLIILFLFCFVPLTFSEDSKMDMPSESETLIKQLELSKGQEILVTSDRLVSLGEDAVTYLLKSLTEASEVRLKGALIFILGRIGSKEATVALTEAIKDEKNAYIRRNIIEALGKIQDVRSFDVLVKGLSDQNAIVRERAARALGNLANKEAITSLIAVLSGEKDERVKIAIINALGVLKDKETVNVLFKELASQEDLTYKNEVVIAIGEIGDPSALPVLISYKDKLSQYKPKEAMVLFQIKEAIKIVDTAIKKIETVK